MAVKTRWDKKTYRRHMFNRGRGVHSPHEVTNTHKDTAEFIDSQLNNGGGWWETLWRGAYAGKLSAAKEYEQYNNPASRGFSPFTFDSDERGKFRDQDRKEVRQLFAQALKDHHFVKSRKVTQGRLDKIVDAYMSQDDDKFQDTLRSMGVSDRDAVRFTRAAEDAASQVIEAKKYDGSWSDDPYQKGPVTHSTNEGSETSKGPANGRSQVGTASAAAQDTGSNRGSIPPRTNAPKELDLTTVNQYGKASSSDSGGRLDGYPVETGDESIKGNVKKYQNERAKAAALQAQREREGIQTDMKSDDRQNYQKYLADQDKLDADMNARLDRRRAERMDKRYKERTLIGMADWENLGRDSTKRDFGARAKDESDESWNARSGAVAAVEGLRKRFTDLGVKDADKNELYAYNPNRMRDVSGLENLFNKAVKSGSLTDAQIEGLDKTLDMYEEEGRKTKDLIKERVALNDAENVRRYRKMYGLMDRNARGEYIISNDEVKEFHKGKQKATRDEILKGMQVAPGQGGAEGRSDRMQRFSDAWMKLMNNGFDVEGTLDRALSDPTTRKAYMAAKASIGSDDPEAADKLDQIRRRFVMNQAMIDAGLNDKVHRVLIDPTGKTRDQVTEEAVAGPANDATSELPGKSGLRSALQVAEDNAWRAKIKPHLVSIDQDEIDAAKKRGEGSAVAPASDDYFTAPRENKATQQAAKGGVTLRPRRSATQQSAKGGVALRPRRRTS